MRNDLFKIFSLFLLAGAIALSPSFSVGNLSDGKAIEIRIEDILILILGVFWLSNFLVLDRKKIEKPPLFWPIFLWLLIGCISILTNWIFGTLGFERGFFYFLKEVEFFVFYFYVFYCLKSIKEVKQLIYSWFVLAGLNFLYLVYQLFTGASRGYYGEYGLGAICEWGVFPSAAFFLLLFIFLYNIFLYYFSELNISEARKCCLGFLSLTPVVGILGSGSKTVFLAFVFSFLLTIFIWIFRYRNQKLKIKKFLLIIFLSLIFIFISFIAVSKRTTVEKRITDTISLPKLQQSIQEDRIDFIKKSAQEASEKESLMSFFIGMGAGSVGEVHNQYLRNFIETGIIGSIIFLILIFAIIRKSWQGFLKNEDNFLVGLSAGLLIATLAMLFCGFATSPFIVVKPSEVYWFFAAMIMFTLISLENKFE